MTVARRTATRIQDQDDLGSTPGAGNDGYALTWDNDAGAFVLAAMSGGVTDHGALSGLSDDDHSQYLLATGSRTGASSQAQTFTNGIVGPSWKTASDSTSALQLKNAAGTAIVSLDTTNSVLNFLDSSGNTRLSMYGSGVLQAVPLPSTAVVTSQSSSILQLSRSRWTGAASALETFSVQNVSLNENAGRCVLHFSSASSIAMAISGGTYGQVAVNYAYPADALISLGQFLVRPYDAATIGMSVWLQATQTANAFQTCDSGGTPVTQLKATGAIDTALTDTATAAASTLLTLSHNTSGTPAAGFGSRVLWELQSSTTADQSAAALDVTWIVATHASRTARLALSAYDYGGAREGLRIDSNGSAPLIGFYGHAAAAQQVLATGAGATADNIIAALQALGLVKQS